MKSENYYNEFFEEFKVYVLDNVDQRIDDLYEDKEDFLRMCLDVFLTMKGELK